MSPRCLIDETNPFAVDVGREIETARTAQRTPKTTASAGTPNATPLQHVVISVAAIGSNTIIAASPGGRIQIFELLIWNVAAQNLEILQGLATMSGPLTSFPATSGIFLPMSETDAHLELDEGKAFNLSLSAATQVSGWARYRIARV